MERFDQTTATKEGPPLNGNGPPLSKVELLPRHLCHGLDRPHVPDEAFHQDHDLAL